VLENVGVEGLIYIKLLNRFGCEVHFRKLALSKAILVEGCC
jgi:hypothetical protein